MAHKAREQVAPSTSKPPVRKGRVFTPPSLPADPLPTGRQAVPTEGGAGRNKELMLSISTIPQDTCLSTKRYAGAF
jgi:hypothetical protein